MALSERSGRKTVSVSMLTDPEFPFHPVTICHFPSLLPSRQNLKRSPALLSRCSMKPTSTSWPPQPGCWPSSAIHPVQKFPSQEASQLKASFPRPPPVSGSGGSPVTGSTSFIRPHPWLMYLLLGSKRLGPLFEFSVHLQGKCIWGGGENLALKIGTPLSI